MFHRPVFVDMDPNRYYCVSLHPSCGLSFMADYQVAVSISKQDHCVNIHMWCLEQLATWGLELSLDLNGCQQEFEN